MYEKRVRQLKNVSHVFWILKNVLKCKRNEHSLLVTAQWIRQHNTSAHYSLFSPTETLVNHRNEKKIITHDKKLNLKRVFMKYDKYAFLKPVQNGQSEYRHFNWFVHYTLKNSMQSKLAAIHLQSRKTKHVRQLYSAVNRSWCFPINVRIQKNGCWNATARWLRLLPWLLRYGSCSRVVHPTSDVSRQCRGYLPSHKHLCPLAGTIYTARWTEAHVCDHISQVVTSQLLVITRQFLNCANSATIVAAQFSAASGRALCIQNTVI